MEAKEIRRCKDVLRITGLGIIAFGAWNITKILMFVVIEKAMIYGLISDSIELMEEYSNEELDNIYRLCYMIFVILVLLIMICDVLIRLYVGRCAIAESKGIKKKNFYLVIAVIMAVLSVVSMVSSIRGLKPDADTILNTLSTIVVEMTSFITLIGLFASVRRLR